MPNFSRGEVVLVRYPFSDLSGAKVRPGVIVNSPHPSRDALIVPLTSKTARLFPGEFVLRDWRSARLHVPTAVKRGLYTIRGDLVVKSVGVLTVADLMGVDDSLRGWLGLAI